MVKIYYGMSGTLKYTLLKEESRPLDTIVLSDIKPHLMLSQEFLGKTPEDLDFAVHRLLQYQGLAGTIGDVRVERGITDFLESWTSTDSGRPFRDVADFIEPWTLKEMEYLRPTGPVIRELLVMLDEDFICDKVLTEPSRSRRFPNLRSYLSRQSEYVDFTCKWNNIDKITEITDAYGLLDKLSR